MAGRSKKATRGSATPVDPAAVLADYADWLGRQPLAERSRDAYLAQVSGFVAWLAGSEHGAAALGEPNVRDCCGGDMVIVDDDAGTIAIDHGPAPQVEWPAMTMGFTADPAQRASVIEGDKVNFTFRKTEGRGEIVSLSRNRNLRKVPGYSPGTS